MANSEDLKSSAEKLEGSSPSSGTNLKLMQEVNDINNLRLDLMLLPLPQKLLWCNSHRRRYSRCLAGESGITLPCEVVDLTGLVEIEE